MGTRRRPVLPPLLAFLALGATEASAAGELKVTRVREFACTAASVGDRMDVGGVDQGDSRETLFIRPADADCNFHLFHASASGTESRLSPAPGGYQLVHAVALASGSRAICASNAVHKAASRGNPKERSVQTVPILCWVGKAGAFSPAMTVVAPDPEYAAWIRKVGSRSNDASTWQVEWVRDFSFQFMNLSDAGRPGTDGVYETTFTVKDGKFALAGTKKISDKTVEKGSFTMEPWDPTAEEMEEFQRVIESAPPGRK